MPPARETLRWSAYEHEHIEREGDWFWALGIVAVCSAIISILFHDVLFAILIVLAASTLGLLANVRPDLVEFELNERGIRVDGTFHSFHNIISFWVEEEGVRPLLLIDTTKPMAPNLIIPIENTEPHIVRTFMLRYCKEVPMKEPASHKVIEFFGL